MQLEVLNSKGEQTGRKIDLPDDVFAAVTNDHIAYLSVKQYLGAQRQGTHKVKNRKEVKGASRKLHKQKGTGGSRKGNIRNPLYKGGGTIFGPKPHKYEVKLNRRERVLAKISALTYKANESNILVLEELSFDKPKTKLFVDILKNLKINNKKVLFLADGQKEELYLSVRNIPSVSYKLLLDAHAYDLMNADVLVFTEKAAQLFSEIEKEEVVA